VSNPKSGSRCLYRRFRRRLDLDSFWLGLKSFGLVSDPSAWPRIPRSDGGCRALLIALERGSERALSEFRYVECRWSAVRLPDSRVFEW
jgi:hypothetical protein